MTRFVAAVGSLLFLASQPCARAAPVIIVGENIEVTNISQKDLKHLCTGSKTTLDNARVELVLPPEDSETLQVFLEETLGVKANRFEAKWMRLVLSGNGAPPKRLGDLEAALYVATHPLALAVVDDSILTPEMTVLEITED